MRSSAIALEASSRWPSSHEACRRRKKFMIINSNAEKPFTLEFIDEGSKALSG
jgi:hypothetical protein